MSDDVERRLLLDLSAWFGRMARLVGLPTRLGGGLSSESYRFDVAEPPEGVPRKLVLRLMREDRTAARECEVQRAVAAAGFPTPRVFHTGDSGSAFGRPFTIMAFDEGCDPIAAGLARRV